jgi:Zn-dependent protease
VCPCGRLAYGKRLAARARDAEALEQRGEPTAARDAWAETLAFLPEDAAQASEIRARIAKLETGAPSSGGLTGAKTAGLAGVLAVGATALKSSKLLVTGLTMLASIWIYSKGMGLPFAALFVLLIWVHEMGHVIAFRVYRLPVSAPVFIPFLGALVRAGRAAENAVDDAWLGLGGPLLGSVGALAALFFGHASGNDLLLAVGHVAVAINLFNLIPVTPLDGSHAAKAMTPRLWALALLPIGALAWRFSEPLLVLAALLPLGGIIEGARLAKLGGPRGAFHQVAPRRRIIASATYVGLVVLLVAIYAAFEPAVRAVREKHKTSDLAWITSASE